MTDQFYMDYVVCVCGPEKMLIPRKMLGNISSIVVKVRLHAKNQLPRCPGSALKVCGWVGAWWYVNQI